MLRQGSLAVLPFEVIGGDEEQHYFADGLTDDLIVELARFKHLFVSSQSAVSSYEPKTADPRVVGRELGVKHVLLGQVRRIGERVRISVRLVDTSSGENLWAERYERRWNELFDLLDELIGRIALRKRASRFSISANMRRPSRRSTVWRTKPFAPEAMSQPALPPSVTRSARETHFWTPSAFPQT